MDDKLELARRLVAEIEWTGLLSYDCMIPTYCPWCHQRLEEGHRPGCKIVELKGVLEPRVVEQAEAVERIERGK